MSTQSGTPTIAWTGERMVPHLSDPATELFHWQRYLYFRPWYVGAKVIDAASGEGYGINYASNFALEATGFDISDEAVTYANARYIKPRFNVADVCDVDYSSADVVTSFETIEHLPDPVAFLRSLKSCTGKIVISTPNRKTHSPGNELHDKPLNHFHTIEWTPNEFAELIRTEFPDRQVRFLSQEMRWPGLIREGLDDNAMYCIAVIGDGDLPAWPKVGISIPTVNNADMGIEAIMAMTRYYPGEIEFAVVTNGTTADNLAKWNRFASDFGHFVTILGNKENLGYGQGANQGLAFLSGKGGFELYGVSNDDVYPSVACLSELANAFLELKKMEIPVGMLGPVSNNVAGLQQVQIGHYDSLPTLMKAAEEWVAVKNSAVTPLRQVRGLFFVMPANCLETVGGFDPIYGIGNFEDDDLNLRIELAGYQNFHVDGAFLYHEGSKTFRDLKTDYNAIINRNAEIFLRKWGFSALEQWIDCESAPTGAPIYVPLDATFTSSQTAEFGGCTVDLIHQASDIEFVAYLATQLAGHPREIRAKLLSLLDSTKASAEAVIAA